VKSGKFIGIDLDAAFDVLLRQDEECFNHKLIVWAGICAWLKSSNSQSAAKKAIAKETARSIVLAEQQAQAKFMSGRTRAGKPVSVGPSSRKATALNGIAHTWAMTDARFQSLYHKVFFPIGGMQQVVGAFSRPKKTRKTKSLKERSKPSHHIAFRNLMKVATVFDYHHRVLSADASQFGKPSIDKASKALRTVANAKGAKGTLTGFSRSQIQDLLKEHRSAIALLYGAHCVRVDGTTLLELLVAKTPRLDVIAQHLPKLLSYGKYFREQVLPNTMGNWSTTYGPTLKTVSAQRPSLDPLTAEQVEHIKNTFREKRPSEAKVR